MLRQTAQMLAVWRHRLFEASLLIKGLLAASEAVAGLGLWLTPNALFGRLAHWLTRTEVSQEPTDAMALWFGHLLETLSIQTQHFYALYLLSHGLLKLFMVLLLQRRTSWAYPAAILVLLGFVTYQLYDWSLTHSPFLLVITGFDLFMAVLVWREWLGLRQPSGAAAK